MNNKGKASFIIAIIIGIVAIIAILGAAVFANGIPSKMTVNGTYTQTSNFDGEITTTTLKFNALKGTFQRISDSGNITAEGKYEVYNDMISFSNVTTPNKTSMPNSLHIDGDVLYSNDWISEEDIPDGDRFDATATFSFSRGCFVFTFKSDGTYVEELTTNVSDEPVSSDGTYTRDGSFIYLTSSDDVLHYSFFVSNKKLIHKPYIKSE